MNNLEALATLMIERKAVRQKHWNSDAYIIPHVLTGLGKMGTVYIQEGYTREDGERVYDISVDEFMDIFGSPDAEWEIADVESPVYRS